MSSGLLAAGERFVADEVLPAVADWDRDDVLPETAERRLRLHGATVPAAYRGKGGVAGGVSSDVVFRMAEAGGRGDRPQTKSSCLIPADDALLLALGREVLDQ